MSRVRIVIEGYWGQELFCSENTEERDITSGQQLATMVYDYLVKEGIIPSRLQRRSLGCDSYRGGGVLDGLPVPRVSFAEEGTWPYQ